ncbi:nitrilase-related carbon-nitrogen hydrolase [Rhodococcus jostii]|uniref:Nitrilase-related carbon-nitrogen hydrolase n=1 Tax=Rhodococcus jostii TaxID=132919 RepID=A0ABU4CTR5_RHOJO|nr:nitrilase-related carbon-nitrogen hydrolase [Rhodococcus jostii]MDV6286477.1 nitrilase-related carbon-nitrogen hydrolase [Rhodococcus jostii]
MSPRQSRAWPDMETSTRVACAQLSPVVADPEANRGLADRAIRQALVSGAQVIILPELATTGYHLEPSEAADLAEDVQGASITAWVEALRGSTAVVVGGFCERGSDGNIYNSAAMVSSDGVMSVYRKTHLWDQEHRLFVSGAATPPVVDTPWGPVGIAVCYDLFFPEVTRGLALGGARLLAVPTNSPSSKSRMPGSIAPADGIGHTVARSAAYLNRVYVAVCDRHGDERGHAWTARSSIIGPEGEFLAGPVAYNEELLLADCDLADAERKQWDGTTNDAFADRRPELYHEVITTGSA